MAKNLNNWASSQSKRYDGEIRQQYADTVEFTLFNSSKPYRIGVRADIAEWNKLGITFKQIAK